MQLSHFGELKIFKSIFLMEDTLPRMEGMMNYDTKKPSEVLISSGKLKPAPWIEFNYVSLNLACFNLGCVNICNPQIPAAPPNS